MNQFTPLSRVQRKAELFEAIIEATIEKAAWDTLYGGSGDTVGEDSVFQDFNHVRGSNNSHNWEDDGDMRWDDYSGM